MITVNFDPNDVMSIGDFARGAGVTVQGARVWVNTQLRDQKIPTPMFILDMGSRGKMPVWSGDDGRKVIEHYKTVRLVRG